MVGLVEVLSQERILASRRRAVAAPGISERPGLGVMRSRRHHKLRLIGREQLREHRSREIRQEISVIEGLHAAAPEYAAEHLRHAEHSVVLQEARAPLGRRLRPRLQIGEPALVRTRAALSHQIVLEQPLGRAPETREPWKHVNAGPGIRCPELPPNRQTGSGSRRCIARREVASTSDNRKFRTAWPQVMVRNTVFFVGSSGFVARCSAEKLEMSAATLCASLRIRPISPVNLSGP